MTKAKSQRPMTEANFQRLVIDAARNLGWRVAHFRPAQNGRGDWRTPVAADGAGFPDLVLAHHEHGIIFAELKTDRGQVQTTQYAWINRLSAAAGITYDDGGPLVTIWRPRDWDGQIIPTLKHGRARYR